MLSEFIPMTFYMCKHLCLFIHGNVTQLEPCFSSVLWPLSSITTLPKCFHVSETTPKRSKKRTLLKTKSNVTKQFLHFNGNCNPIRLYSMEELNKATNNFHWDKMLHRDSYYRVHEGVHEDSRILVKMFSCTSQMWEKGQGELITGMRISDLIRSTTCAGECS